MATAVFLHAHPDDEAIATGGTMLLASRAGHRVVLVCATDGSLGETSDSTAAEHPDGFDLATVREAELRAAAEILGVHRVEMLGYRDSGMAGDPANDDPACFWQADDEQAAARLAAILRDEAADLLTCYDANGNYGHPDHIKVHRVGVRAAELAGVALVYEATIHREHFRASIREQMRAAAEAGLDAPAADELAEFEAELDSDKIGTEGAAITHFVDVRSVLADKRAAMRAHASQIPADSFLVALSDEAFDRGFGTEWFIRRGSPATDTPQTDLFAPLAEPSAAAAGS